MVYIYKKIINKKPYYYLRLSKRVNNKIITKDIAYLGGDASKITGKFDNLSKYKVEIRKAYKNIKKFVDSDYYFKKVGKLKNNPYISTESLKNIEAIKLHFNNCFLKLNKKTIIETYESFLIDFAFNTTSIEGNTITLKEAEKLLRENLTPKEKSPREIFDLQNTQKAFFYLTNQKPDFNQELIIKIHDLLIDNIDERRGYRTHEIRVFKSRFNASPAKYVVTDMDVLFKWYNQFKNKLHPVILTGLFHQKFEKIHPFSDGNGRTGRIIMNYLLLINDFPPIIVRKKRRADYLQVLSKADKANLNDVDVMYFNDLIKYLVEELMFSYWNNFNV